MSTDPDSPVAATLYIDEGEGTGVAAIALTRDERDVVFYLRDGSTVLGRFNDEGLLAELRDATGARLHIDYEGDEIVTRVEEPGRKPKTRRHERPAKLDEALARRSVDDGKGASRERANRYALGANVPTQPVGSEINLTRAVEIPVELVKRFEEGPRRFGPSKPTLRATCTSSDFDCRGHMGSELSYGRVGPYSAWVTVHGNTDDLGTPNQEEFWEAIKDYDEANAKWTSRYGTTGIVLGLVSFAPGLIGKVANSAAILVTWWSGGEGDVLNAEEFVRKQLYGRRLLEQIQEKETKIQICVAESRRFERRCVTTNRLVPFGSPEASPVRLEVVGRGKYALPEGPNTPSSPSGPDKKPTGPEEKRKHEPRCLDSIRIFFRFNADQDDLTLPLAKSRGHFSGFDCDYDASKAQALPYRLSRHIDDKIRISVQGFAPTWKYACPKNADEKIRRSSTTRRFKKEWYSQKRLVRVSSSAPFGTFEVRDEDGSKLLARAEDASIGDRCR